MVCDSDENCKGYVGRKDKRFCEVATTTTCPPSNECKVPANKGDADVGSVGDLQEDCPLGQGIFTGCFIKLKSKLVNLVHISS